MILLSGSTETNPMTGGSVTKEPMFYPEKNPKPQESREKEILLKVIEELQCEIATLKAMNR